MKRRLGVWIHLPDKAEDTRPLFEKLAAQGVTTLCINFKGWAGHARFPSEVAEVASGFGDGRRMAEAIAICHALGMEFEAWSCVFTESQGSAIFKRHPECVAQARPGSGPPVEAGALWACPARPESKEYELAICREFLERYPGVDRLHLDYIRYPWSNGTVCFCDYCRSEFSQKFGFDLCADAGGPGFDAFVAWRCGHIRDMVARARALTSSAGKGLTAAVFPFYPSILFDLGQDWVEWCQAGLVDAVYPMNYNWSALMVGRYTRVHAPLMKGAKPLLAEGLQVDERMAKETLQALCRAALDAGSQGLMFFTGQMLAKLPEDTLTPFAGNLA